MFKNKHTDYPKQVYSTVAACENGCCQTEIKIVATSVKEGVHIINSLANHMELLINPAIERPELQVLN